MRSADVDRDSANGRCTKDQRKDQGGPLRPLADRHDRRWSSFSSLQPVPTMLSQQNSLLSREIAYPTFLPPSYSTLPYPLCPLSYCGAHANPLPAMMGFDHYAPHGHSTHIMHGYGNSGPCPTVMQSGCQCSSSSYSCHSPPLSTVREMSKPENNAAALNWRRLHLSRAKLKASARTSALLSGFAMVAMVEINLQNGIPEPLLIAFCVCTTLLVSVHMLALMISTCILPNLEAVASIHGIVAVNESPHEKMHLYIEAAWGFSTVFGILLFMAEIAIICWVVFIKVSIKAALAGTIILIPVVLLFTAFALHFYRNLVAHKFERSAQTVQELEDMVNQLQAGTQHRLSGGSQVLNV